MRTTLPNFLKAKPRQKSSHLARFQNGQRPHG
jgi:hypothetical protein